MDTYLETFEIASMVDGVMATVDTLVKQNGNRLRFEVDRRIGGLLVNENISVRS